MGLREERAARQDGAQQESEGKGVPLPNSLKKQEKQSMSTPSPS